jgi:phosphoglycolate phosphatase-like HAD superfamily hydrolase
MKIDRLFLMRGCPSCSAIKVVLGDHKIQDDAFFGKNGHRLFVFSASSSDAGRELLDRFGLNGYNAPVLVLDDWTNIVYDVGQIIDYLRNNNFDEGFRP